MREIFSRFCEFSIFSLQSQITKITKFLGGEMLCVFDCESVPDSALLREVYGYSGDDLSVCKMAFAKQKEFSGSEFLPLPFHKIIMISVLECDDGGYFKRIGNFGYDEADSAMPNEGKILERFLYYLNKQQPKLVSFNGRNFDLPAIMLRAMKYHLSAESYFETDNAAHNKNKWENYRSKFSENFHIDLMDALSSHGAVRGLKLDVVCKMAGIVGKFDMSGDDVWRLYFDGEYQKIAHYCQSDVLNTYWLYLKYQLLQGKIALFEYADLLNVFLEKMPKDRDYSEIFESALRAEMEKITQNLR
ncbi:3'-5' exonuclease [Helicobacter sp. 23-1044]